MLVIIVMITEKILHVFHRKMLKEKTVTVACQDSIISKKEIPRAALNVSVLGFLMSVKAFHGPSVRYDLANVPCPNTSLVFLRQPHKCASRPIL